MNPPSPALPSLWSLRARDTIIRRTQNMTIFGILAAVGIQWANQPVPGQPPSAVSLEASTAWLASLGGLVFSAICAFFMIRRYLLVKKILSQGTVIKGMLDDISVHATETNSNDENRTKANYRHSYHAHISYHFLGEDRKVRVKLPFSGFVLGLKKGQETELVVLESLPKRPLIRSVYVGRWTK